jgi:hypothetical protein
VGRLAVERILAGHGFDITALDLGVAVDHFLAAADQLGAAADAHQDLGQVLAANPNAPSYFRTPILKRVGAKSCLS